MGDRLPLGTRYFAAAMAKRLPPRPHEARLARDLPIEADGAVLLADHYSPRAAGRFPTLLVRSPYGRGFPWGPLLGATFASFGFHVAIVAVRGTGGSTGEFRPFVDDGKDDPAVLAWLRAQEWFDGRLVTAGPSYLGWTQLPFLADPPPELRAAVLMVAVHDPGRVWRPRGALQLENLLVAAAGLDTVHRGPLKFAATSARLAAQLRSVARTGPFATTYARATGRRVPWFEEWLEHRDLDDEFWRVRRRTEALDDCRVPVALIGGRHDLLLDQTLEQYARLRAGGTDAELTVGPWTHTSAFDRGWAELFTTTLSFLHRHLGESARAVRRHRPPRRLDAVGTGARVKPGHFTRAARPSGTVGAGGQNGSRDDDRHPRPRDAAAAGPARARDAGRARADGRHHEPRLPHPLPRGDGAHGW